MTEKVELQKPQLEKDETLLTLYITENNGVDACCPSGQSGNCAC